jgi:hypothetical protein
MAREFRQSESQDFTIVDDGIVVGHIRIKPNRILWAGSNKKKWTGVSLDQFAEFAAKNGTKQAK